MLIVQDRQPQGRFLLLQNLHFHHPWRSDADAEPTWMDIRRVLNNEYPFHLPYVWICEQIITCLNLRLQVESTPYFLAQSSNTSNLLRVAPT